MTAVKSKPIAIVTPWFGPELKGGAEQHAWQIATRLAARGHDVEVLTTCCKSFADDWSQNFYKEGQTDESGVLVRRFPVDPRNLQQFDKLNSSLLSSRLLKPGVSPTDDQGNAVWRDENINSDAMEQYLATRQADYHAFIFLPYLYGIVLRGLPIVAQEQS